MNPDESSLLRLKTRTSKHEPSEENIDPTVFGYEIDKWEKRLAQAAAKPEDGARRLQPVKHQATLHVKSKSLSQEAFARRKMKLPTLAAATDRNDFEAKYLPKQESLLAEFEKEIYTDETFRKLIVNYTKARTGLGEEGEETERGSADKDSDNVEDLNEEIQRFFQTKHETPEDSGSIIEKTRHYEALRAKIERRIAKKIRNSEAFVNSKQITTILFRKENSYIIDKMAKIKHLVIFFFVSLRVFGGR